MSAKNVAEAETVRLARLVNSVGDLLGEYLPAEVETVLGQLRKPPGGADGSEAGARPARPTGNGGTERKLAAADDEAVDDRATNGKSSGGPAGDEAPPVKPDGWCRVWQTPGDAGIKKGIAAWRERVAESTADGMEHVEVSVSTMPPDFNGGGSVLSIHIVGGPGSLEGVAAAVRVAVERHFARGAQDQSVQADAREAGQDAQGSAERAGEAGAVRGAKWANAAWNAADEVAKLRSAQQADAVSNVIGGMFGALRSFGTAIERGRIEGVFAKLPEQCPMFGAAIASKDGPEELVSLLRLFYSFNGDERALIVQRMRWAVEAEGAARQYMLAFDKGARVGAGKYAGKRFAETPAGRGGRPDRGSVQRAKSLTDKLAQARSV